MKEYQISLIILAIAVFCGTIAMAYGVSAVIRAGLKKIINNEDVLWVVNFLTFIVILGTELFFIQGYIKKDMSKRISEVDFNVTDGSRYSPDPRILNKSIDRD